MSKNLNMEKIGKRAKIASNSMTNLSLKKRNEVLKKFNSNLKKYTKLILKANQKDMSKAQSKKISQNMIDRLKLNNKKIIQIRKSINEIIKCHYLA